MTRSEVAAFNLGVEVVVEQARRTVQALAEMELRPIRKELALAALDQFAQEAESLKIEIQGVAEAH